MALPDEALVASHSGNSAGRPREIWEGRILEGWDLGSSRSPLHCRLCPENKYDMRVLNKYDMRILNKYDMRVLNKYDMRVLNKYDMRFLNKYEGHYIGNHLAHEVAMRC